MKRLIDGTAVVVLAFVIISSVASAASALAMPNLTLNGATLSWNAVNGADGYNIYLNDSYKTTVRNTTTYEATASGEYYIIAFDDQATGSAKWSPRSNIVTVRLPTSGSVCNGAVQFKDDFSGDRVDDNKWRPGLYWGFTNFGTGEKQHYVKSFWDPAFKVRNGNLEIRARRDSSGTYLSGAMTARTNSTPTFGQGCYEIRAKVPITGSGTWPAFWLISNTGGLDGNRRPEIDVFEHLGQEPGKIHFAAHYLTNRGSLNQAQRTMDLPSRSAYHTYSVRWNSAGISWYLDGRKVKSTTDTTSVDMYLHLNLAMGGWGGAIDPSQFSGGKQPTMYIDYVMVTT